jgi:hypothetical protein
MYEKNMLFFVFCFSRVNINKNHHFIFFVLIVILYVQAYVRCRRRLAPYEFPNNFLI